MIKFLNIQMYVYVPTNDEQSLLFSHEALPKCRENYGDSFRVVYGIYDGTEQKF